MITVEQMRAARALLNWTQDDLADRAILSKPSINNIERRVVQPRTETLRAIQGAFEKTGVEFIEGGVRFRTEPLDVKVMEGSESVPRLLQDVLETLTPRHDSKRELLVSGIQEKKFMQVCEDRFLEYLQQVQKHKISEKLLALENDTEFVVDVQCYRWVPMNIFSQVPYFVYGDKYAMILWGPPQKVIVISNEAIAENFRRQFYAHWNQGQIPTTKK